MSNSSPEIFNLYPPNGFVEIPTQVVLSWEAADAEADSLSFSVYLDTLTDPTLLVSDLTESNYSPTGIKYSTVYYWRVAATDVYGNSVSSSTMTFTTRKAVIAPLVIGNKWRYHVTDGSSQRQTWRLEITGSYFINWDERQHQVYHWHWFDSTTQTPDPYYWLMRNEDDGLWTMGIGNLAGDTAWISRAMVAKSPVEVGDSWVIGEEGGYTETWVCASTDATRTTPAGTFSAIKYSVTVSGTATERSSPFSRLWAGKKQDLMLATSSDDAVVAMYIYYVPDLGLLGVEDGSWEQWLNVTNVQL